MGGLFASMAASLNKPVRVLNTKALTWQAPYGTIISRGLDGSLGIQLIDQENYFCQLQDVEFIEVDEFERAKLILEIMKS